MLHGPATLIAALLVGLAPTSEVTDHLDAGLRRGIFGLPSTARGIELWRASATPPRATMQTGAWTFGIFDPTTAGLPAFLCCNGRHGWGRHSAMQSPVEEDASTVGRGSRRGIYRFHQPVDR